MILCQKWCDYASYVLGYSKYTIARYRQVVDFYHKFTNFNNVEQITEESIRNMFFYGRTERKWSTNTYSHYHKTLKVFLRFCIKNGCNITKNFIDDIEKPRIEKKLPPKLNKQEALKLLELSFNYPYKYRFLRYRNHAIFAMFIYAGLRKRELLNLKYADVDVENLSVFVRQGKGKKDRIVPMSYTLAQILKDYLKERRRLNKTCPEFFASLNHNEGLTDEGLKKLIILMNENSGIEFTAHRLRHTFATLMLEGGCDIYSLSRMMGHADIKTTTIYLYASAEHLRGEMTKHPLNNI